AGPERGDAGGVEAGAEEAGRGGGVVERGGEDDAVLAADPAEGEVGEWLEAEREARRRLRERPHLIGERVAERLADRARPRGRVRHDDDLGGRTDGGRLVVRDAAAPRTEQECEQRGEDREAAGHAGAGPWEGSRGSLFQTRCEADCCERGRA